MDIVPGTSTNIDGLPLFLELSKLFSEGYSIRLDLKGLTPMSTSFLNSSFGELADKYGYEIIKKHLVLFNYKKSDAMQIKNYLLEITA